VSSTTPQGGDVPSFLSPRLPVGVVCLAGQVAGGRAGGALSRPLSGGHPCSKTCGTASNIRWWVRQMLLALIIHGAQDFQ
jgi:hypothetical protein